MLLRRLNQVAETSVKPATRGRSRPVRCVPRRVKADLAPASSTPTHGRRLRRGAIRPMEVSSETPYLAKPAWNPAPLYPFQAGLHMGLNGHMPLPVPLGVSHYAKKLPESPLFEAPKLGNPLAKLPSTGSSVGDHLAVVSALAHPALNSNLGSFAPRSFLVDVNADAHVASDLEKAAGAVKAKADFEWEMVMANLGASSRRVTEVEKVDEAAMKDALAGLDGLLARMSVGSEENMEVQLDSVRRKRQKKMSKHKHKKRRKVSYLVVIQADLPGDPG